MTSRRALLRFGDEYAAPVVDGVDRTVVFGQLVESAPR